MDALDVLIDFLMNTPPQYVALGAYGALLVAAVLVLLALVAITEKRAEYSAITADSQETLTWEEFERTL